MKAYVGSKLPEILLTILAAAAFSSGFYSKPAWATPANLDQAVSSYNSKQYAQAIQQFDLYAGSPGADQSTAHYYKGLCYQCLNQVAKAESEYQWVISNGNNPALRGYAQTALDQLSNYKGKRSYQGFTASVASPKKAASGQPGQVASASAATRGKPKVLDFWAEWCGVCKSMDPIVEEAQSKYAGKVEFQKVNFDDPGNADLNSKYQVTGLPTYVFLDGNGQVANRMAGGVGQERFMGALEKLVGH